MHWSIFKHILSHRKNKFVAYTLSFSVECGSVKKLTQSRTEQNARVRVYPFIRHKTDWIQPFDSPPNGLTTHLYRFHPPQPTKASRTFFFWVSAILLRFAEHDLEISQGLGNFWGHPCGRLFLGANSSFLSSPVCVQGIILVVTTYNGLILFCNWWPRATSTHLILFCKGYSYPQFKFKFSIRMLRAFIWVITQITCATFYEVKECKSC